MGAILDNLGITWNAFIPQLVNFAIVLFVLYRFAYKPILDLLEQRREKIAESIQNADRIKEELAQTEAAREDILQKANAQATQLIEEARAAAAKVKEQETQKAVQSAEQIIAKAREATESDRAQMLADLKREVGQLVVQATAKVSGKVLTDDDQRRLVDEANKELAA